MKAEKYLESIGLEDVKDTEFFNDDDKSWYKLPELMEAYHQAKLDLLTIPGVVKPFYCGSDYNHNAGRCKSQCRMCDLEEKKGQQ